MKHLSQVPKPPSELRADIPHDLDAVVTRALAKDPDQRYGSAEEMDADLARVARGVSVSPRDRGRDDAGPRRRGDRRGTDHGHARSAASHRPHRPRIAPRRQYYEEPPRGRSVWPWLIALGLIIAGGIGGWFLYTKIQDQLNSNKPTAVPDVKLLARRLAVAKIKEAGLVPLVVTAPDDTVPKGQVSIENPAGGSKVAKGSTVTLTVSTGMPQVQVPSVIGQDVNQAVAALAQLGLDPNIVRIFSTAQADTVTAQQPHAGDRVAEGDEGADQRLARRKPVQVPDVTGEPFANAKSALQGQGFTVSRVDIQSDQAQGVVVASDPPAGSSVAKGSK